MDEGRTFRNLPRRNKNNIYIYKYNLQVTRSKVRLNAHGSHSAVVEKKRKKKKFDLELYACKSTFLLVYEVTNQK